MQAALVDAYEELCGASKVVYATAVPAIEDPVSECGSSLYLFGKNGMEAQLPLGRNDVGMAASMLAVGAMSEGRAVIGWDLKGLFGMLAHKVSKRAYADLLKCRLIDLKYAEAFLGLENEPPDDLNEAMARASSARLGEKCLDYHRAVHVPLAREVLPAIESLGVFDARQGRTVFPWHDIEGIYNGRLRCVETFQRCINPHSLSEEGKAAISPVVDGHLLLVFDYAHMEPAVLQWLSGDRALGELLADGGDPYDAMAAATGLDRDGCKVAFLAVLYGQGPRGMADQLGVPVDLAVSFRGTLRQSFPQAWAWLEAQEARAGGGGEVEDYFGRRRRFEERAHRARNWSVSSPAAAVCLERLVALHRALEGRGRILFSVHDGYHVMIPRKAGSKQLAAECRAVLEDVGGFAPGLKLTAVLRAGEWYGKLAKIAG